ncbi:hypothetical protein OIO90_001883 [Microbotryomycetes sp. JL221]|nr:hypothetical protein OIO90_001883 [Microbotryomycetes sp. JL221]
MFKFTFIGLSVLGFALSVAGLGLSARLCAIYGSQFPNGELGGVTRQIVFAHTWNTLFLLLAVIGQLVAPSFVLFRPLVNFIVTFLGFLQTIVGAGSLHSEIGKSDNLDNATLFRATEGLTWSACWIIFFVTIVAFAHYVNERNHESKHRQLHDDEEQVKQPTQQAH